MTPELADRQTVPLTSADRKRLRRAAVDFDVSPGLLARALILAGLERIGDTGLDEHIRAESERARSRASAAGKEAMRVRYGRERPTEPRKKGNSDVDAEHVQEDGD